MTKRREKVKGRKRPKNLIAGLSKKKLASLDRGIAAVGSLIPPPSDDPRLILEAEIGVAATVGAKRPDRITAYIEAIAKRAFALASGLPWDELTPEERFEAFVIAHALVGLNANAQMRRHCQRQGIRMSPCPGIPAGATRSLLAHALRGDPAYACRDRLP